MYDSCNTIHCLYGSALSFGETRRSGPRSVYLSAGPSSGPIAGSASGRVRSSVCRRVSTQGSRQGARPPGPPRPASETFRPQAISEAIAGLLFAEELRRFPFEAGVSQPPRSRSQRLNGERASILSLPVSAARFGIPDVETDSVEGPMWPERDSPFEEISLQSRLLKLKLILCVYFYFY